MFYYKISSSLNYFICLLFIFAIFVSKMSVSVLSDGSGLTGSLGICLEVFRTSYCHDGLRFTII